MIGWQTFAVAIIILAASVYVGRRVWAHIRSLGKGTGEAGCATGCGGCENNRTVATPTRQIIQLSRSNSQSRRLG